MSRARELADLIGGGFTEADIPNLSASKITSGTFADARIAASNVSQHASSFDDNKIVNDISTLGLRVHTQENLNASNTNSASFDVFQDSSGVTNLTNCTRNIDEYVSSIVGTAIPNNTTFYLKGNNANGNTTFTDSSSTGLSLSPNGGVTHSDNAYKIGSTSIYFDGTQDFIQANNNSAFHFGTGEFHMECYIRANNYSGEYQVPFAQGGWGTQTDYSGWGLRIGTDSKLVFQSSSNNTGTFQSWAVSVRGSFTSWVNNTWYHIAASRASDGKIRLFKDGVEMSYDQTTGQNGNTHIAQSDRNFIIGSASDESNASMGVMYLDHILIQKGTGVGKSSNFTPVTSEYGLTANATGSFEGVAITAASTNKMGAVITYQDNAGTNTLNTDIVLKLSADNGSNYSTATLTALPDFATGIKMAKVNDLSVTAGTQLKYKIEFANQASGSKEARLRGVSLQY